MKLKSLIAMATVMAVGCSGNKENTTAVLANDADTIVACADIRGQWFIDNIVLSDSEYVRPAEVVPDAAQYFIFEDSTYSIMTNCNSFSGTYVVNGDSITINDGAMTEMACENMATEDALRKILPRIKTIVVQSDTLVCLNGMTPAECILLRKATTEVK